MNSCRPGKVKGKSACNAALAGELPDLAVDSQLELAHPFGGGGGPSSCRASKVTALVGARLPTGCRVSGFGLYDGFGAADLVVVAFGVGGVIGIPMSLVVVLDPGIPQLAHPVKGVGGSTEVEGRGCPCPLPGAGMPRPGCDKGFGFGLALALVLWSLKPAKPGGICPCVTSILVPTGLMIGGGGWMEASTSPLLCRARSPPFASVPSGILIRKDSGTISFFPFHQYAAYRWTLTCCKPAYTTSPNP